MGSTSRPWDGRAGNRGHEVALSCRSGGQGRRQLTRNRLATGRPTWQSAQMAEALAPIAGTCTCRAGSGGAPELPGGKRRLSPIGCSELRQDVFDVEANSAYCQLQLTRNLLIGLTGAE